jgi:hypothetical protein
MGNLRLGRFVAVLLLGVIAASSSFAQAPAASEDERIKALEERIIALEGQVRLLKQQAQATPPAQAGQPTAPAQTAEATVATVPPTQAGAAPVGAGEIAGQTPTYGGNSAAAKALNPDISVIGDFIGSAGHNFLSPTPAFQMHESEIGFQSIIDPYARGDFFLSFGEEGVNLEEGYITLTALPAGFVVKGGKMRAAFGKVNTLHNHVLPWVDRPLVTNYLVGGEDGINDAGLSVTRILPAPKGIFLEGTAQVFRGDSADVFKSSVKNDVSVVGHLRGYRDISESTNVDIGVSYGRGHNDVGSAFLTHLYGVDATLRWKPLRRAIYHSFVGRSEFIWSNRDQLPFKAKSFGWYASGDYQLGRRWFVGGRFDRSGRSTHSALVDDGGSLVLTYWPSEFSQVRGQYRLTNFAEGVKANEFFMQLIFSLGAHGAHPF